MRGVVLGLGHACPEFAALETPGTGREKAKSGTHKIGCSRGSCGFRYLTDAIRQVFLSVSQADFLHIVGKANPGSPR